MAIAITYCLANQKYCVIDSGARSLAFYMLVAYQTLRREGGHPSVRGVVIEQSIHLLTSNGCLAGIRYTPYGCLQEYRKVFFQLQAAQVYRRNFFAASRF
jgi:hypothetical protein